MEKVPFIMMVLLLLEDEEHRPCLVALREPLHPVKA